MGFLVNQDLSPTEHFIQVFIKVAVFIALPFVYLYLYVQVFEIIHSGRFFYSEEWGSSMMVMPPGDSLFWIKINFYFQIFIEHGTAIILVSGFCLPFVWVFFKGATISVTVLYSFICVLLLSSTKWPDANIPYFVGSSFSQWLVSFELQLIPLLIMLGLRKKLASSKTKASS